MKMSKSYSLSWAVEHWRDFINKYARAADILQRIYDYDPILPIRFLAEDQERWEKYKKCVKYVDNWMIAKFGKEYPDREKTPTHTLSRLKKDIAKDNIFAGRPLDDVKIKK